MSKNGTNKPDQQADILADKLKDENVPTAPSINAEPDLVIKNLPNEPVDWIIVVDDSPANLTIVCGVLNKLGFGTISYRDGQLALNGIASLSETRRLRIRAIFSDLLMPNLDGLELLTEIRKSEKTAKLPFVMVTSSKERENIAKAAALKINAYLLKPITATTIIDTVHHLFPEKSAAETEARLKVRRV